MELIYEKNVKKARNLAHIWVLNVVIFVYKNEVYMDIIRKSFDNVVFKNTGAIDTESQKEIYEIVISTSDMDSYGDIMVLDGVDTSPIDITKAIFYNHESNQPPICKHLGIYRNADGTKLIGKFIFNEITQLSKDVKKMVDFGNINCASIGFVPLEANDVALTEDEVKQLPSWVRRKRYYPKSQLLEWSIVNIPANINANVENLKKMGYFNMIGDDVAIEKAGRKLSGKNLERIKSAHEAAKKVYDNIGEVLQETEDIIEEIDENKALQDELTTLRSVNNELNELNRTLTEKVNQLETEMKTMVKINIKKG